MDQHDVHCASGAEPVAETTGRMIASPGTDDPGTPASVWECYSLDTLAAVLDFEGFHGADW